MLKRYSGNINQNGNVKDVKTKLKNDATIIAKEYS